MDQNQEQEILAQIRAIKAVLVDDDKAMPVSGNALIIWGIIALIVMWITPEIYNHDGFSITQKGLYSALFLSTMMGAGLVADYLFIKGENRKLERVYSRNQRFVTTAWFMLLLVAVVFTVALALFGGWELIYYVWMVTVGLALFITGFFSKKLLQYYGLFLFTAGILLVIGGSIWGYGLGDEIAQGNECYPARMSVFLIGKYATTLFGGIGVIITGILLRQRSRSV